jgi:hypothetical protein
MEKLMELARQADPPPVKPVPAAMFMHPIPGRFTNGTTNEEFSGAYPLAAPLFATFSGVNPSAACTPLSWLYGIVGRFTRGTSVVPVPSGA